MTVSEGEGFLGRWSRRKALVRGGQDVPAAAPAPLVPVAPPARPPAPDAAPGPAPAAPPVTATAPPPPPPTLADVDALTPASDFTRFVARDVAAPVKNAALKKLFADPHFNVMDGLDTYIDDYGRADPIPPAMLRELAQAAALRLFEDDPPTPTPGPAADPTPAAAATPLRDPRAPEPEAPDEDADLRLQPHAAAGCAGAEPGAGPHPRRER